MVASRRDWVAVVNDNTARAVARSGWQKLAAAESEPRPAPGDRIVVMVARRVRPIATAAVCGTADVRERGESGALGIRHRVIAPEGHEPRLTEIPVLVRRVGLTDERLLELVGALQPLAPREFGAVEAVVRETALAFGPPPKRKAHSRPRTPGRRALATARIASRSRRAG